MNVRATLLAAVRGLYLALWAIFGSLVLFVLSVLSTAFIALGIGIFTKPAVFAVVRGHANARRRLAHEWYGVEIPVPYRPRPDFRDGFAGRLQRVRWLLTDPATWRDLLWLIVDATAGFTLAILAASLMLEGLFGWVLAAGLWRPLSGHYWYGFIPIEGQASGIAAAALGTVYLVLALRYGPRIMRAHALLTRALLRPTQEAELKLRVARLAETRADAVDVSAAELRRIERDLHDGAQARLVAMGMSLGTIEHLMEQDPAKAKALLAEARRSSAEALTELRHLVRGIHPPVLAERGLADAVRALAMASPLKTEVSVDLPGRPAAPVESAAYFAISEVLTNAAKHSGARRVWLDLRPEDGMLRINITDDGTGGANPSRGTGLRGIERRLGTFDGVLAVSSPEGGPTMVTMELPCEL